MELLRFQPTSDYIIYDLVFMVFEEVWEVVVIDVIIDLGVVV